MRVFTLLRFGLMALVAASLCSAGPVAGAQGAKGPLWISPAYAPFFYGRFQICNATSEPLDIATLGLPTRRNVLFEGWTHIASRGCAVVHDAYDYGLFLAARGARTGRTLNLRTAGEPACAPYPGNFRLTHFRQSRCLPGTHAFTFFVPPAADLEFQGVKWARLTLHNADFNGTAERKVTLVNFSYYTVNHAALFSGNHSFDAVTHPLRPGEAVTVSLPGFSENECRAKVDVMLAGHGRFHSAALDTCATPYLGIRAGDVVAGLLPNYFAGPAVAAAPPVAATLPPESPVSATMAPGTANSWVGEVQVDRLILMCDTWGDDHCVALIRDIVDQQCDGPCPGYGSVDASAAFLVQWMRDHQNYVNPNGHRLGNQTVRFALYIAWSWLWAAK